VTLGRRSVFSIVCCVSFLLTCFIGVAGEAVAKPVPGDARGTVDFKTASGADAVSYNQGDTVYLRLWGTYGGGLGPCFTCEVFDRDGNTQFIDSWYTTYLSLTATFLIGASDPVGQWKAVLTYSDTDTPPRGVKLDTDKVDVLVGTSNRWAVIVDGGTIGGSQQEDFDQQTEEAYTVIMNRGYTEERICLLTPYNDFDADNDGDNDQTRVATKANVQWAIETWLDASGEDDRVFIYFVNHGSPEGFGTSDGYLLAADVGGWIDGVVADKLVFVIEACYSGTWEDDVSAVDRIFISSADDNELAGPDPYLTDWPVFSHSFFTRLSFLGESVETAFAYAYDHVLAVMGRQTPQMSDQIVGNYFL
jgi:hypothetical protein